MLGDSCRTVPRFLGKLLDRAGEYVFPSVVETPLTVMSAQAVAIIQEGLKGAPTQAMMDTVVCYIRQRASHLLDTRTAPLQLHWKAKQKQLQVTTTNRATVDAAAALWRVLLEQCQSAQHAGLMSSTVVIAWTDALLASKSDVLQISRI